MTTYLDILPDDIQEHIHSMAKKMEEDDLSRVFRVGMFSTTQDGDLLYISKRTKCYLHISQWVGTGVQWLGKYKIRTWEGSRRVGSIRKWEIHSGTTEYITQDNGYKTLMADEINFKYA